jgi:hypothetical protein
MPCWLAHRRYGDTGDLPIDASGTYDATQYEAHGSGHHEAAAADDGTSWHVSAEMLEAWRGDLAAMGYATADLTLEQLYYLYMQQYTAAQEQCVEPTAGEYG